MIETHGEATAQIRHSRRGLEIRPVPVRLRRTGKTTFIRVDFIPAHEALQRATESLTS